MLTGLTEIVEKLPQFQLLRNQLYGESSKVSILEAATPVLLGALWKELKIPMLIVVQRPEVANRLFDQLVAYFGEDSPIYRFPELEALPFEQLAVDRSTVHQRLWVLAALAARLTSTRPIVITSATGLAIKAPHPEELLEKSVTIERGQTISMEALLRQWQLMGYVNERATETPGQMSRRGGILDIFPPGNHFPTRLEFLENTVESIRFFDVGTQRSLGEIHQITVIPAKEQIHNTEEPGQFEKLVSELDFSSCPRETQERIKEEISLILSGHQVENEAVYSGLFNQASLFDFFPSDSLFVIDEPASIEVAIKDLDRRTYELETEKSLRGEIPRKLPSPCYSWAEVSEQLDGISKKLELSRWRAEDSIEFPFLSVPTFQRQMGSFIDEIGARQRSGQRVLIATHHSQRLQSILAENEMGVISTDQIKTLPPLGSISIVRGSLTGGWILPGLEETSLFTDLEIFGSSKVARPRRGKNSLSSTLTSELEPGSFVVHIDHGVAKFSGSTVMTQGDDEKEYLILDYAGGDKLYVPSDHANRISRYLAPGDKSPSLTRLNTQEWTRTKQRVQKSARDIAKDLLELYAEREAAKGIAFPEDTPWQMEIEDAFPYEETPDQLLTINQVKRDMEQARPMDRLIAGDVGYGKTEIALRAAFKAVAGGKQVAILAPTTVLAQQHYETFRERLSPYPVTVDVLSRFRSIKEQKHVLRNLADGKLDICIGTHRLLQRDVGFKDLGLAIIDEEHKFGVDHKERLKKMRAHIDVLALTATPIPRTLHMVLSGIRDMSTMETPPEERLPIKTYVAEKNDDLIREAIIRELERGGQVYYLHNRIKTLPAVFNQIERLVPEASVGVAHGRMPEDRLEQEMAAFMRGEKNVLVCTTIIESGLDLSTVNTLIVERADALGLAQLYQLRGRIGRGNQRSYAYFLINRNQQITETAQKRLETILAATSLGAGFRIAMKDLEIRGAGQVLGSEQSGHIHAIGFDMYQRLLSQAVEEVKAGGDMVELMSLGNIETSIDLKIPAMIPDSYVSDLSSRLAFYQRISDARKLEEVTQIQKEIADRYGSLPAAALNLFDVVRIKLVCSRIGIESISKVGNEFLIRLRNQVGGARGVLQSKLGANFEVGNRMIRVNLNHLDSGWYEILDWALNQISSLMELLDAA
jgi:transcription-repair coupling factor (superfamily II helicase)